MKGFFRLHWLRKRTRNPIPPGTQAAARVAELDYTPSEHDLVLGALLARSELDLVSALDRLARLAPIGAGMSAETRRVQRQIQFFLEKPHGMLARAVRLWPAPGGSAKRAVSAACEEISYLQARAEQTQMAHELLRTVEQALSAAESLLRSRDLQLWRQLMEGADVRSRVERTSTLRGAQDLFDHVTACLKILRSHYARLDESAKVVGESQIIGSDKAQTSAAHTTRGTSAIIERTSSAQVVARLSKRRPRATTAAHLEAWSDIVARWRQLTELVDKSPGSP